MTEQPGEAATRKGSTGGELDETRVEDLVDETRGPEEDLPSDKPRPDNPPPLEPPD